MLAILRRIVQEVSSASDLQEALHMMVHRVGEAIQTEACSVYLVDRQQHQYKLGAFTGFPEGCVFTLDFEEGLVGLVGQRAEPINVRDATLHPQYHYVPQTQEERFKAFLGVPIIHQREVVGVLVVQQRQARKFDEWEEAFLVTVSAQLAGVIAHAQAVGRALTSKLDRKSIDPHCTGIPSALGVAMGFAAISYQSLALDQIPNRSIKEPSVEEKRFLKALASAKEDIQDLCQRLQAHLPAEEQVLFEAYLQILDSRTFSEEVKLGIAEGQWAPAALRDVVRRHASVFRNMEDPYLRERASDIEDLGRRIMMHLMPQADRKMLYPPQTILVSEEVTASMLAEIPEAQLVGIISATGTANSHVAILARAMGIPTIMGATGILSLVHDGDEMILDGYSGRIFLHPEPALRSEYQGLVVAEKELQKRLTKLTKLPAETTDGHRVHLWVNTGLMADIQPSLQVGAEGVGLYRTEVPFLIRDCFPSEAEQYSIYRELLEAFAPKPVILRTLDVGGDKPLPYFHIEEENPSLGWRGLRLTLDHPEIFLVQLRAMLRASVGLNNHRIMLPMVSQIPEIHEAIRLIRQAFDEVSQEGLDIQFPKIGVMIEVPSVIYLMDHMAPLLDFFSVGSNDLTQYLLAVDRNNRHVSQLYDACHPAVLLALKSIVERAHHHGKMVSVCGEMAGDPVGALLLMALGFDALSMSATSIPRIKWVIRSFSRVASKELLAEALQETDPKWIRRRLSKALEDAGLGGLIRPDKGEKVQ